MQHGRGSAGDHCANAATGPSAEPSGRTKPVHDEGNCRHSHDQRFTQTPTSTAHVTYSVGLALPLQTTPAIVTLSAAHALRVLREIGPPGIATRFAPLRI